ncbi:MAG TPA: glycosyltransferase, partial [Solirubrobacteraceae bacterium]|nr:glycosyltransferase [Solirubrobacteraceae bacterium]
PVGPEWIPSLYQAADAGVVPLRDRPIFSGALPTKLFEVLAAARPAIVAARGEAADLVREAGAGLAVAPEDPGALADAFRELRGSPEQALQMGRRGRLRATAFSRASAVERWYELLRNLEPSRQ